MVRLLTIFSALALTSLVDAFQPIRIYDRYRTIKDHEQSRRTSFPLHLASEKNQNDKQQYSIQILMSDTGGGHRASANALRDALDYLYPGKIHCDIVDIFTEYGPFFPFNAFVPIYKIMAEYSFLWKWSYEFGATPFGLWMNELLLETFCFDSFKDCMSRTVEGRVRRADMVVSVHPLTQDIPLKILNFLDSDGQSRTKGRKTPFVTIVTDLGGAHPTWFNPGVDRCFVPTDVLYQCALDRKLAPNQIIQHGLPIRKGFWAEFSSGKAVASPVSQTSVSSSPFNNLLDVFTKNNPLINTASNDSTVKSSSDGRSMIQKSLNLVENIPTVLIVGGGDGMGGIVLQAEALGAKLQESSKIRGCKYQMVVVCGKNQIAQETLSAVDWGQGIHVQIKGFVNNMDEWMKASDILVTKAGPGTIAEAAICGLPCMLSSFLPGQEEGNVPFVENAGFGSYRGNPEEIAETVSEWLTSPQLLSKMKENALKAARPNATLDIAKDLASMLFNTK